MYKLSMLILAIFIIASCNTQIQHLSDAEVEYHRSNDKIKPSDSKVEDLIAPYRSKLEAEMNTELGTLTVDLKKGRPNSNMGNWFCDVLHIMAEKYSGQSVDFAIQNYGGLRIPFLSKGPVTRGNIFELMPFDNKLVVLKLDGKTTKQLFDQMAGDGGWPISGQVQFKISDGKATNIKIKDQDFDPNQTYLVALPDYVANGGGDCFFLKDIKQEDTGTFIRDVIIEHLLDQKELGKTDIIVDNAKRIF